MGRAGHPYDGTLSSIFFYTRWYYLYIHYAFFSLRCSFRVMMAHGSGIGVWIFIIFITVRDSQDENQNRNQLP
ncbi:hypothetical protein BU24DRAFT_378850, partial [Aaosphaeria arxii CBS 175.79]